MKLNLFIHRSVMQATQLLHRVATNWDGKFISATEINNSFAGTLQNALLLLTSNLHNLMTSTK